MARPVGRRRARQGVAIAGHRPTAVRVSTLAENPLIAGLERLPAHPTALTIFGASGDLARRKLLPALYNLAHDGSLPGRFALVGIARGVMSDADFRAFAEAAIR